MHTSSLPPLVLLAGLLSLAPASPVHAQSACTLRGRPARLAIDVPAVGDAIVVTGHRVEVVLGADRARSVARLRSPIAFEGSVDPLAVAMYPRPGHGLADGTLLLGGTAHVRIDEDGSAVVDVLSGVTAVLPALPCSALTLTPLPERAVDAARLLHLTHRIEASSVVPLFASGDAAEAAATLRTTEPFELTVTRTREGRAHVSADVGLVRLSGWVDASLLTALDAPHEPLLYLMGDLVSGLCGRSDHPYAYDGPGRVRAGATVRGPSGAQWGHVTRSLEVARVGVRAFDSQVELIRVEGLTSEHCGQELLFDLAVVSGDDVTRRARAQPAGD